MTPAAITPAGRITAKRGKPPATQRAAAPRAAATPRKTAPRAAAAPRTATASRAAAPRSATGRTAAPPKPVRIINPAAAPSVPGHRRRLRPQAAPKAPRRISGPARGRAAGITLPRPGQGGDVALPLPGRGRIVKPRSRPARGATRPRSQALPLPRRLFGAIRTLPDHPLLDRVVRGRAWIAVLGVMLAGIVAMQIEVLKLGASIGRSLQSGSSLQSRNEQLRASVAELGDDQRIERLAATMGMVMPAAGGVGFVSVGPGLVTKAIANIHPPNTAAFLSLTGPNGAVTGASPASGTSTASATSIASTTTGAVPGTTSPAGISGQTAQTPTGATSAPAIIQPATPASSVPQTTSPASAATGAAGTAALTPTQASSPTPGTGGAGVPSTG
jgi:hypothetical protein